MTDKRFKEIRKAIQGKYYMGRWRNAVYYRYVIKVKRRDDRSEWFFVAYKSLLNLYYNGQLVEKTFEYWAFESLEAFYGKFGKRITPSEYNKRKKEGHAKTLD